MITSNVCAGVLTDFISKRKAKFYTGIDLSLKAIQSALRKRPNFLFIQADAEKFNSQLKFDMIVFNEMLYYTDHNEIFLRYEKFLSTNGFIVISLWGRESSEIDKSDIYKDAVAHYSKINEIEISGITTSTINNETRKVIFRIVAIKPKV